MVVAPEGDEVGLLLVLVLEPADGARHEVVVPAEGRGARQGRLHLRQVEVVDVAVRRLLLLHDDRRALRAMAAAAAAAAEAALVLLLLIVVAVHRCLLLPMDWDRR